MKINVERIILVILLLCTFRIIFGFSGQNGTKSSGISRKITVEITKNIEEINNKQQDEKEEILYKWESVIRKIAHFSIYTVVRNTFNGIGFNI